MLEVILYNLYIRIINLLSIRQIDDEFLKGSSTRTVVGSRKWIVRFEQDLRSSIRGQSIEPFWFSGQQISNVVTVTRAEAIEIMISKRFNLTQSR